MHKAYRIFFLLVYFVSKSVYEITDILVHIRILNDLKENRYKRKELK